jgi:hypothetical protein
MKKIEEAFKLLTLIICDGRLDYTKEKVQLSSATLQDAKIELATLKQNLKGIEYISDIDCCPACNGSYVGDNVNHHPDCWLKAAISD